MTLPAAVFVDVDFTLIHPGPRFQVRGYQRRARSNARGAAPVDVDPRITVMRSLDELPASWG